MNPRKYPSSQINLPFRIGKRNMKISAMEQESDNNWKENKH